MPNNIRLIDANVAFRFLTEQLVEERGAFSQGINKGLNIARSALRNPDAIPTFHDMPIGDPLTLKQLRGMHGRWVWIVSRDKDLAVSGWAYVGTDHVFTYWEYQPDKLVGRVVYNIGDYGEWLAYTYPPAYIDRSEWTAEWKEYTGADAGFHYCSKCKQQAFNYDDSGDVVEVLSDFCPSCGRAMTPEAWAELKNRLRGVRG